MFSENYSILTPEILTATLSSKNVKAYILNIIKVAANAEADVGSSARRILLMEDEADKSENRLATSIRSIPHLE